MRALLAILSDGNNTKKILVHTTNLYRVLQYFDQFTFEGCTFQSQLSGLIIRFLCPAQMAVTVSQVGFVQFWAAATARQERFLQCLCHEYWPPQAHDVYRVRPLKRLFVFLKGKSRRPDHPGVAKQCTTFITKRASKRSRKKSETQGQLGNNGNKAIFATVCFLGGSLLVFSDQPAHRPSCRATVTRD